MSEVPEGMISLDEFAKIKGLTPSKVIEMMYGGFFMGQKIGEDWFFYATESSEPTIKPFNAKGSVVLFSNNASNEVIVTHIQMPFFSMVFFMVKWAIASIPAFIILFIIFTFGGAILNGIFAGLMNR